MQLVHLAYRRRQHLICKSALLESDAETWHAEAIRTWIRRSGWCPRSEPLCLSAALAGILRLPLATTSLPDACELAVLAGGDEAAAQLLADSNVAIAIWVTAEPEHLLATTPELAVAESTARIGLLDLSASYDMIDLDTPVERRSGHFTTRVTLRAALALAERGQIWQATGARLERQLVEALMPQLPPRDGDLAATLELLGDWHPLAQRVRRLREQYLQADAAPTGLQRGSLPAAPRRRAWLETEAKRYSKTLAVKLPFARLLLARDHGAASYEELLNR